jgi:hypothetical protein
MRHTSAIGTAVLDRSRPDRYGFAMPAFSSAGKRASPPWPLATAGAWRGGRVAEGGGLLNRYTV